MDRLLQRLVEEEFGLLVQIEFDGVVEAERVQPVSAGSYSSAAFAPQERVKQEGPSPARPGYAGAACGCL